MNLLFLNNFSHFIILNDDALDKYYYLSIVKFFNYLLEVLIDKAKIFKTQINRNYFSISLEFFSLAEYDPQTHIYMRICTR